MLDDVKVFQPHRGEESVWSASGSRRDESLVPRVRHASLVQALSLRGGVPELLEAAHRRRQAEKAVDDPRLPSGGDVGQGGLHDRAPVLPLHATVARREDVKGGDGERIAGFDVRGGRRGDRGNAPGGRASPMTCCRQRHPPGCYPGCSRRSVSGARSGRTPRAPAHQGRRARRR